MRPRSCSWGEISISPAGPRTDGGFTRKGHSPLRSSASRPAGVRPRQWRSSPSTPVLSALRRRICTSMASTSLWTSGSPWPTSGSSRTSTGRSGELPYARPPTLPGAAGKVRVGPRPRLTSDCAAIVPVLSGKYRQRRGKGLRDAAPTWRFCAS